MNLQNIQNNLTFGCWLNPDVVDRFGNKVLVTPDVPSLGCLAWIVLNIINVAFMFLGAVALIFLILGALRFVLSGGDPKAIQSAQKTMTYAVIGTIAIILSFLIINFATTTFGLPDILSNFTFFQP